MTIQEKISRIIAFNQHQDSLLQSYRNFHLNFQTILLASGAAVTTFIFSSSVENNSVGYFCSLGILVLLFLMSMFFLFKMKNLILRKGMDVKYWQSLLENIENNINDNDEKLFLRFLINTRFNNSNKKEELLSNFDLIKEIPNSERGKTRSVFSWLFFNSFLLIWAVLIISIFFFTVWQLRLIK